MVNVIAAMFPPLLLWLLAVLPLQSAAEATVLGIQNFLNFNPPPLEWKHCGEALQCTNLAVPLDWDQSDGPTIDLYLNKFECKEPKKRIGSLIFNPGGPGESGSRGVHSLATELAPGLLKRFDLIGLDPRGVGFSSPVSCNDTIKDASLIRMFPSTQEEFEAQKAENLAFAQSCVEVSGEIVKHVDTINVAKDLEATRIALGGDKLNFLGFSYGTMIASTYASLFPKNIRAMVMDGNLDHTADRVTSFSSEATGLEQCFNRFADWCSTNPTCVLQNSTIGARGTLKNITDHADTTGYNYTFDCEPIGCRSQILRAPSLLQGVRGAMYTPTDNWPSLGDSLNETLITGDPTSLEGGPGAQDQPQPHYPNRTAYAFAAVTCLDWNHASTLAEIVELDKVGRALGPYTHGITNSWDIQKQCIGWPFSVKGALNKKINVSSDVAPILIVQSTYDPATAFTGAVNLHRQIPNSVFLTREGDGHLSYPYSEGIRQYVDDYLVNGTLPKANTVVKSNSLGGGYGA